VGIGRTSDGGRAVGLPTVEVDRSRYEPKEIVMNPIRHLRRIAAALVGLAGALLAFAATAPAAFAVRVPTPGPAGYITPGAEPPGWNKHPPLPGLVVPQPAHQAPVPAHTVVVGGMPGWQIALIAIGAALLAATTAVLVDRARAARRKPVTAAA
jgi:hypothetical protein